MNEKTLRLARRTAYVEPFHVMELLSRARELESGGRSIVHMEIGEPDFPTPPLICEAGIAALRKGALFYTPALGLPQLREAIAAFYHQRYGVEISPGRVIITSGSSAALLLAVALLVDPGDRVLVSDPGYPCNRHFVRVMGGEPVGVAVGADSNYQLNPELVARHWDGRTVATLAASPSNPTGTLIPGADLRAIAELAKERGGALIVDEIYHGLVYEGAARTALEVDENVFIINSFSKYFHMTGWRLGWMVAPQAFMREIETLAQNIYLAAPTPAQYAALAAFAPETMALLETHRNEFKARRDYLVPALRRLGFDIPLTPEGAFYIYAGCSSLGADSFALAHELLERAGVAVTPGIDFGSNAPERHVRFAYTNSLGQLQEGVRRIDAYLAGLSRNRLPQ